MTTHNLRYLRQIALPGFGQPAQSALESAHVAVVGAGGLGSPVIMYLAAAGIGKMTLIDDDSVDLSNLHRQVIHATTDIGQAKVASAARTVSALNPEVAVEQCQQRLTDDIAHDIFTAVDVVIDCSDNFETRHVISAACAAHGIPHVWGSILGYDAQLSVFWAGKGPVYEDLRSAPPAPGVVPTCVEAGVLGPVVGAAGATMALETVKLITGVGTPLLGTIACFEGRTATWEYVPLRAGSAQQLDCPRGGNHGRSTH